MGFLLSVVKRQGQGMSDSTYIGVIGGSGIYQIDGLDGAEWVSVEGPWGAPSDQILTGALDGVKMAFLPRHGRGHVHSPTTVPYRANIDALKRLGVTDVVSVGAPTARRIGGDCAPTASSDYNEGPTLWPAPRRVSVCRVVWSTVRNVPGWRVPSRFRSDRPVPLVWWPTGLRTLRSR